MAATFGTPIRNAHRFDSYNRNGPKVFEGEWATQEGGMGNGQRPATPSFTARIAICT